MAVCHWRTPSIDSTASPASNSMARCTLLYREALRAALEAALQTAAAAPPTEDRFSRPEVEYGKLVTSPVLITLCTSSAAGVTVSRLPLGTSCERSLSPTTTAKFSTIAATPALEPAIEPSSDSHLRNNGQTASLGAVSDNSASSMAATGQISTSEDCCLIEGASNSVRVSLRVRQLDAMEVELTQLYIRFICQRADSLDLLRRVPVEGYDVSFLATQRHLRQLGIANIVKFTIDSFLQDLTTETASLKAAVNDRGRAMATDLLRGLAF